MKKPFKSKEDFFNRANVKTKLFIKYQINRDKEDETPLKEIVFWLPSALIECGFRYISFDNGVLEDIVSHYYETTD